MPARGIANIIGQEETVKRLRSFAELYVRADKPLGHLLLSGPEGSGKRTIARAFAQEFCPDYQTQQSRQKSLGTAAFVVDVEAFGYTVKDAGYLEKRGDLTALLTSLETKEALIFLSITRLRKQLAEILIPALSDFQIALVVGQGPGARIHPFRLNYFTCIATATSETECPRELLEAFPLRIALQPYSEAEMERLTATLVHERGLKISPSVAVQVARGSRGSPHQAELLLERLAQTGGETVTEEHAARVLSVLGLDTSRVRSTTSAQNLSALSGVDFENLIATLLQRMGFRVEMTKATGDGGIDIVAVLDRPIVGGRYLIQCKRFAVDCLVSAPTVRELYGALVADREAAKGVLITTSAFSAQAREFAANLPLELIDGDRLRGLLVEHGLSE